jgi:hypothetical protein
MRTLNLRGYRKDSREAGGIFMQVPGGPHAR